MSLGSDVRNRNKGRLHLYACVGSNLKQQTGVLASLGLQQRPLPGSGPENQAEVPGCGDGHVILQVPPEGAVTEEAMWVWHG